MLGSEPLSEIRRKLREMYQGDPEMKAWVSQRVRECEANGTPIPDTVRWVQKYTEGEPIKPASRRRTRPTAQGKKVMSQLTQLIHDLEAELANVEPASRRRTQTTTVKTVKKTRKRTAASAAN